MKAGAALFLLLANVGLNLTCYKEETILICSNIPSYFDSNCSSLVMILKDVGEINSTMFHSDNLASVTRLTINNAGVTNISRAAFASLRNLSHLSFDGNLLSQMDPDWLGQPAVLRELSLTGNRIEVISQSMLNGLRNLTKLRLNKNKIRRIDPGSFSSQTNLEELDLSENEMTQVSPQIFRSRVSAKIRLDGNPWDCSCGSEDSVAFLRDLQSRSLLDRQMDVTCKSPPSLRGQPAWNVSACVTPPPLRPLSATHSSRPEPTDDALTAASASSAAGVTDPPSRAPSKTEASVRPKASDAPAVLSSSHSATLSPSEAPVRPEPSTPTSNTGTYVTSSLSRTASSIDPKPTSSPLTASQPAGVIGTEGDEETGSCSSQPAADTSTVSTLAVVIGLLSLLLFVACFLAVLGRRKRNNKTVTPGVEDKRTKLEEDSGSSCGPSPELSENSGPGGADRRRSFSGVRAKSASAVILTSPFHRKDQVTLQIETDPESKSKGNPAGRKRGMVNESEAGGGGSQEHLTNGSDISDDGRRNLDEKPHRVSVSSNVVPYLSIGTNQSRPSPDEQSSEGPGQRSQGAKVMGRISTWPPTAVQWQARCKMKAGSPPFLTRAAAEKLSSEVKTTVIEMERPSGSDGSLKPNKTPSFIDSQPHTDSKLEEQLKKEVTPQDSTTATRPTNEPQNLNQGEPSPIPDLDPVNGNKSGDKDDLRKEPKPAVSSRQRAEHGASGSKAPSGGASPDDETLLSGNEYAFMDLLHEVVQNNGRWTRERWRQIHANKQRR